MCTDKDPTHGPMKPLAAQRLLLIAQLLIAAVAPSLVAAQDFGFEPPASATDTALPAALKDLAERILPVYQEDDADRYLANLSALQMVVGDPAAAHTTRLSLQERLQSAQAGPLPRRTVVYDIYTQARAIEATEEMPFTSAYAEAFGATLSRLNDLEAYELEDWFITSTEPLRDNLQSALDEQRGKTAIALEDALDLLRAWFAFEAYRSFGGIARPLVAEEIERRYVIDEEVAIPVSKDTTLVGTLVRPRAATSTGSLPTLLEFTLDRASRDPREAAAHGYVSVLALARIAGDPKFRPRAPFESDGDDARAVIEWIAAQPWSDGRVGMQGHGYGGFVAWSAAKRLPAALKAIATSDPVAPGIDVPMSNRIVRNSAYRWVYELLAAPDETPIDDDRWREIDEDWYRSGRIYRELPTLPGRAGAVFRSWLNHPSYDRFWQKWLPFGAEFGAIDIPVLTVTGYYSAGETAALYYFTQHHAQNAEANHSLLIGPFDEQSVARGASSAVGELALDPVALVDPNAARYQWFDHALEGAERPELLSATVNYQLAGADEWRHEPSLEAPESKALRLYLQASPNEPPHALVNEKPSAPMSLTQTLSLRDRADVDWRPARGLILEELEPRDGTVFVTEPFVEGVDLAGQLRGVLDFTINKYDVDLVVMLYELRSDGTYVKLFEPAYAFRASYARDPVRRRLLLAGVRQQLPFQSERMVGRRLEAGSRLALAIGINKRADQQINYGGTHDVSEQSIEDAGAAVRIRWHDGSFIEIPSRERQAREPVEAAGP
jgi:putative CocE/NonD family hydrolase